MEDKIILDVYRNRYRLSTLLKEHTPNNKLYPKLELLFVHQNGCGFSLTQGVIVDKVTCATGTYCAECEVCLKCKPCTIGETCENLKDHKACYSISKSNMI